MAYGNWGAFVWREGERMQQWEDNTPFRETDLIGGYWQAFMHGQRSDDKAVAGMVGAVTAPSAEPPSPFTHASSGFKIGPHHASLGAKGVRLCGYKAYPTLYNGGAQINLDEHVVERAPDWEGARAADGTRRMVLGDPLKWRGVVAVAGNPDPSFDGTYRFAIEVVDPDRPNQIDLALVEPDGTRWTSRCGYCFGAGYEDESGPPERYVALIDLLPKEAA